MTDELPEELRDRIERLASTARPTEDPVDEVRRGIQRRRRHRAVSAVGGSAVLVAAVAVAAVALPSSDDGSDPAPTGTPSVAEDLFTCPIGLEQYEDPPPIPDLAEQQAVVENVLRVTAMSAWTVRVAEPTHLGVVALVMGDLDVARQRLEPMGVRLVRPYNSYGAEEGIDDHFQVVMAVQQALDSLLDEVQRATRDVPGRGGFAYWQEAGAIVVQWKAPVAPEVEALAGRRSDGAEVLVWPTAYSGADIHRAMGGVEDSLRASGDQDRLSSFSGCADLSGLQVGIVPPIADRAALQEQLTADLGMPVMVVAEERAVAH